MGKKEKEKKAIINNEDIDKMFDPKTEAGILMKEAQKYHKRGGCRTGWAVFFCVISILCVVVVALSVFPILKGEPVLNFGNDIIACVLAGAGLSMILALVLASSAKEMYKQCNARLVRRGEVLGCTPLYIKMV